PDRATGVQVTDLLPAGLILVSATASQGIYSTTTGLWTVGQVDTAAPATLTLQARVDSPNAATNTAMVSHSDQFDPMSANNTARAREPPQKAALAVAKTVSNATPTVGDTITFPARVSTAGPDAATGVPLTDLLPAGLSFVTATPSQGLYDSVTGIWTVGT